MRVKKILLALLALLGFIVGVATYVFIHDTAPTVMIEDVLLVCAVAAFLGTIAGVHAKFKSEQDLVAMKSDFISIASHEIRSPLSAIRWGLSQLQADSTLHPESRKTVDDLHRRVRALIELTGTFLEATSVDHGVMRPSDLQLVDVIPILSESIARAQALAIPRKISVRSDVVHEQKVFIRADAPRLAIVFDNLLSNAIKYSPEGALVSVSFADHGSKKVFSIHDQGMGIPAKDLKDIFKGFHRAQNAKRPGIPGSGFGLYMVKKIVEFHGGSIKVDSKLNQGTTFYISLPSGV